MYFASVPVGDGDDHSFCRGEDKAVVVNVISSKLYSYIPFPLYLSLYDKILPLFAAVLDTNQVYTVTLAAHAHYVTPSLR